MLSSSGGVQASRSESAPTRRVTRRSFVLPRTTAEDTLEAFEAFLALPTEAKKGEPEIRPTSCRGDRSRTTDGGGLGGEDCKK